MTKLGRFSASAMCVAALTAAYPALAQETITGTAATIQAIKVVPPGGSKAQAFRAIPFRTLDPAALARGKARSSSQANERNAPSEVATRAIVGVNKPGIKSNGTVTPPDSTGGVSPKHYIEAVNAQITVYDRALSSRGTIDLDNFVGKPLDSQCDPQIQWDPQANRWFYAALDCDGGSPNFLLFGWSQTANPLPLPDASGGSGNWCRFFIDTGPLLDDYPKLGHNDKYFIIGTNVFQGNPFVTARIWALPKPPSGDTSCTVPSAAFNFGSPSQPLKTADGDIAFTPVPANTVDGSKNGYVTAADFPGGGSANQVMVWHVTTDNPPQLKQDGNVKVPSYSFPANVPQPGTGNVLDSSDTRLTQSVAHRDPDAGNNTAVWTQHTVNGSGGRAVVQWFEIIPGKCSNGSCPSDALRQTGTISSGKHFVFNGAVSPAFNGNDAGIQFNLGSSNLLSQIHARSRAATDPLGSFGGDIRIGSSAAFDQDFSCTSPFGPPCRWGDYSALNPDPADNRTLWGTNMGLGKPSGTAPHWNTRNFSFKTR